MCTQATTQTPSAHVISHIVYAYACCIVDSVRHTLTTSDGPASAPARHRRLRAAWRGRLGRCTKSGPRSCHVDAFGPRSRAGFRTPSCVVDGAGLRCAFGRSLRGFSGVQNNSAARCGPAACALARRMTLGRGLPPGAASPCAARRLRPPRPLRLSLTPIPLVGA